MKRLLMLSLLLSVAALQAIRVGEPHPAAPIQRRRSNVVARPGSLAHAAASGNVEQVKSAAQHASPEERSRALLAAKNPETRSALLEHGATY